MKKEYFIDDISVHVLGPEFNLENHPFNIIVEDYETKNSMIVKAGNLVGIDKDELKYSLMMDPICYSDLLGLYNYICACHHDIYCIQDFKEKYTEEELVEANRLMLLLFSDITPEMMIESLEIEKIKTKK